MANKFSDELKLQAFENNNWVAGDLLNKFTFTKPPTGNSFSDFFKRWIDEANRSLSSERKRKLEEIYAFSYVYAVTKLGTTEPTDSWTDWIISELGVPYPNQNGHYDLLDKGLERIFKFKIPTSSHGRLFISGIGRQSGYFYADYAKEYANHTRHSDLESLDTKELENKLSIAKSKIPRNGNQYDYESIWTVWRVLDQFRTRGILDQNHLCDLAESLSISEKIAERILKTFETGTDGKLINHIVPVLHLTPNDDLEIKLPTKGIFASIQSTSDILVYINEKQFRYRKTGNDWSLFGEKEASYTVKEKSAISIQLRYKVDEETISEKDITPQELKNPLCFFSTKGTLVSDGIRLVQDDNYRTWKTEHWSDDFELWSESIQINPITDFICPKVEELTLRDSSNALVFAIATRSQSNLNMELKEELLASFIPGKRTFSKLPNLEVKSVVGVDKITLIHKKSGKKFVSNQPLTPQIYLAEVFPDCCEYGEFEVYIQLGSKTAKRSFSVLPKGFEHNMDKSIAVGTQSSICFTSSELINSPISIPIENHEQKIEGSLRFKNGWIAKISGEVLRHGAYADVSEGTIILSNLSRQEIDLDDLYDNGKIIVYGKPDEGVSIGFKGANTERRFLGKRFSSNGVAEFSLRNADSLLGGALDYKFLINCNNLTICNMSRSGQSNIATAGLFQYAAQTPQVKNVGSNSFEVTVEVSSNHPSIDLYFALLPASSMDIDLIPIVSEPFAEIPAWTNPLLVSLFWEETNTSTRIGHIYDPNNELKEPGYILFLMKGDRRLSGGRYIQTNNASTSDTTAKAFLDVRENPKLLEDMFKSNQLDSTFIQRMTQNAKRLQANDFLLAISSFQEEHPSGFVFRNHEYWFQLILWAELQPELSSVCSDQISIFDQFWDFDLFAYKEILENLHKNAQFYSNVITSQTSRFCGLKYLIQILNGAMTARAIQSRIDEIDGAEPNWNTNAKMLHEWRKNPRIGLESNKLRNELKKLHDKNTQLHEKFILQSLLHLLNDKPFLKDLMGGN